MKATDKLEVGDVVQIDPECKSPIFAGCLMIVAGLRDYGCECYVQTLGEGGEPGEQAYYRPKWDEMEPVGRAVWAAE